MGHPNEDLVRRGYEAFAAGDVATMTELMADDVVWHTPGRSSISGDQKGRDAVLQFFGKIAQDTGGTFKLDVHDIVGNDEHVVALTTSTGQKDGRSLNAHIINTFHVKDGKLTEAWAASDDQYAVDEFWG
ncbi:MAG: nuclear transport factor 2 family protein [Actinomycetota bacterium]